MENLSPEHVEHWTGTEGDKSNSKEQSEDQGEKTSSSQMGIASLNDKVSRKQSPNMNAEERSPEKKKPKFNAGYCLGDGHSLRDYPDWESSLTLTRWRSNNKATPTEHRSDEAGNVESEQMQVVPIQQMVDELDREQAAKNQAARAAAEVKPTRWEDIVDDPGEWDMCQ